MKQERETLIELLRTGTEAPVHAQSRVWKAMAVPRRRKSAAWKWAMVAVVGVLSTVFVSRLPSETMPIRLAEAIIWPQPGAVVEQTAAGWTVTEGLVQFSVWNGTLHVLAGKHRVEAEAARWSVRVAPDGVEIEVDEGDVLVDGSRVYARQRWRSTEKNVSRAEPSDFLALATLEPVSANEEREWQWAQRAVRERNIEEAIAKLKRVGGRNGLRAETALLQRGQLLLWDAHRPAEAVEVFLEQRRRFSDGSLRSEATVSLVEAYVALESWRLAADVASDFVSAFPQSERVHELRLIRALALQRLGVDFCTSVQDIAREALNMRQQEQLDALQRECGSTGR